MGGGGGGGCTSRPICMCVFGGGVANGKEGVSLNGNGWVGPKRREERDKKKRTRIKMSSTQSFAERKQP